MNQATFKMKNTLKSDLLESVKGRRYNGKHVVYGIENIGAFPTGPVFISVWMITPGGNLPKRTKGKLIDHLDDCLLNGEQFVGREDNASGLSLKNDLLQGVRDNWYFNPETGVYQIIDIKKSGDKKEIYLKIKTEDREKNNPDLWCFFSMLGDFRWEKEITGTFH
ncbi:MAG: hypothetical protein KKF68_01285 [Nanoarchaeota archaeon]|nr:hypothetical protein [Nanoarchaeota archaeon]